MKSKVRSILFGVIILSLSIINIIKPTKAFSNKENRYLQQFPELNMETVFNGEFSTEFEKYASDQFIARDSWIGLKTLSGLAILQKDNGRVYFGKNGFLFDVEASPSKEQMDLNIENLNKFAEALGEDINITALLVPTKTEVFSEELPTNAPVLDEEQLVEEIKRVLDKDIQVMDLIQTFKAHSNEYIYYKTDHHWTSKGAYYAYEKYLESIGMISLKEEDFHIEQVSEDFYGTSYRKANYYKGNPDTIQKYTAKDSVKLEVIYNNTNKTDNLYEENFLEKTDKYSYFLGGDQALVEINTSIKNGKKIIVLKDSFANSFIPFLTNNYESVILLDTRYYNASINEFIQERHVDEVLLLYNIQTFVSEKSFIKFGI